MTDWGLAYDDQAEVADALEAAEVRLRSRTDGRTPPADALTFIIALAQARRLAAHVSAPALDALVERGEQVLSERPDLPAIAAKAANPALVAAELVRRIDDASADPLAVFSAALDVDAIALGTIAAGDAERALGAVRAATDALLLAPDRLTRVSAMAFRHMARQGIAQEAPEFAMWQAIADAAAFEAALERQPPSAVPSRIWDIVARHREATHNVVWLGFGAAPAREAVAAVASARLTPGSPKRVELAADPGGTWQLVVERRAGDDQIALYPVPGAEAPALTVRQAGRELPNEVSQSGRRWARVTVPGKVDITVGDQSFSFELRP